MKKPIRLKLPSFSKIGLLILSVCLAGLVLAANPPGLETDLETCGVCHEELVAASAAAPHSALLTGKCTACHGEAEQHLEEGGGGAIFAFKESDFSNDKNTMCLSCHTKSNPRFMASSHAKASLDCTSCHSIHKTSHKQMSSTKSCYTCHADVFSLFQLNERHRLQEGILACTTCHNPHEPALRERLGGFKDQSCLKCHTDKGGPFLYEHNASAVEGCTSCHEVHGSPNRHMLTQQSVGDLCFSCHISAVSWHSRFTSTDTNCVSCHSTIHGSNLSKIFLK